MQSRSTYSFQAEDKKSKCNQQKQVQLYVC